MLIYERFYPGILISYITGMFLPMHLSCADS